jgi:cytochrome c
MLMGFMRSRQAPLRLALLCLAMLTAGSGLAQAADPVDLAAAKAQFLKSCGTCHTVEAGAPLRQGPNLATAFGRKAGSVAEFTKYSPALQKAGADGLVWDEATLDKWITDAAKLVPGATMPYRQADAEKRKLVIAYLKSLAPAKAP